MNALIDAAIDRSRTTLLLLGVIVLAGTGAYVAIPKESDPDVDIPMIYVSLSHEGISPEDAERLLIRPMEKELQSVEGLRELTATAGEGYGSVTLEFDAGFDPERALDAVREKVDLAKPELPDGTDEPSVHEVNVALFPVLTVILSGSVPEQTMTAIARGLKDRIEALPGVLEVDIGGDRAEMVEVTIDPTVLETYGVTFEEVLNNVQRNNRLVAAGALDTGAGRMVVKVPGVLEDIDDIMRLPLMTDGDAVVTFSDVAVVRRTFRDPDGFARSDGRPAVALEISKRIGANIIDTIGAVRAVVAEEQVHWPGSLEVHYQQDKSTKIQEMLKDLQNNIISAVFLVMVVIVLVLGWRSAILVGISIPGSFLAGILVLYTIGHTLNIVSLFSLILVVGMLVDGAIVVTELADRKMVEGQSRREAYAGAAKRMSWPIIASTATTLAVFFPLLFWPGVVGEFMKYLPITVLACLTASLAMALVFVPVVGTLVGRRGSGSEKAMARLVATERGDFRHSGLTTRVYVSLLARMLRRSGGVLAVALAFLLGGYGAYGTFGRGVEFFPEVEPDFAQIQVRARGDLSVWEKDDLAQRVESRLLGMPELRSIYARTQAARGRSSGAEDVIAVIQLEFIDWDERRPAGRILEDVRRRTADIPGLIVEAQKQKSGPSGGKPVEIQLSSRDPSNLPKAAAHLRSVMERLGGFVDTEDNAPLPGIEWRLVVDREQAARHAVDIGLLGNAVKMVTTGIKIGEYRPDDSDEELDIRLRFPFGVRNLDQLDQLRVPTGDGPVPITNFVTLTPAPKTGSLERSGGRRVITVKSDVTEGTLVNDQVVALKQALVDSPVGAGVDVRFKGEDEDQRDTMQFLAKAFVAAILLMAIFLVTQFNSLYQAGLVLSAIVFSTAGVLIGLLVTGQPFGIVMGGIGVIALAGIVVNNNIVLIDTYNDHRRSGLDPVEAALRTGAQRLRPVVLTSVTTILGLMPMVLAINIDLFSREIALGAPSTQWWTQLSSAVAGGLTFATLLTLLLTPCLLVLGERLARASRTPMENEETPAPAGAAHRRELPAAS